MSKIMRLIIMYDLNSTTDEDKKEYTKFHNFIIKKGYIMMQYSIYMKVLNTPTKVIYEIKSLRVNTPPNGNIRTLAITDNQYYSMKLLRGGKSINETINTESRRVVIKNG